MCASPLDPCLCLPSPARIGTPADPWNIYSAVTTRRSHRYPYAFTSSARPSLSCFLPLSAPPDSLASQLSGPSRISSRLAAPNGARRTRSRARRGAPTRLSHLSHTYALRLPRPPLARFTLVCTHGRAYERTHERCLARPGRSVSLPSPMLPHAHPHSAFRIPSHTASHVILRFRRIRIAFSFFSRRFSLHSIFFSPRIPFIPAPHVSPYASSRIYPAPARTSFLRTLHVASHWLSAWWGA